MTSRLFINKAVAGVARTPARFNHTAARRVIPQVSTAGAVEKLTLAESSVPVMWAVSGLACFYAWNRIPQTAREGMIEKHLIV